VVGVLLLLTPNARKVVVLENKRDHVSVTTQHLQTVVRNVLVKMNNQENVRSKNVQVSITFSPFFLLYTV